MEIYVYIYIKKRQNKNKNLKNDKNMKGRTPNILEVESKSMKMISTLRTLKSTL